MYGPRIHCRNITFVDKLTLQLFEQFKNYAMRRDIKCY